MPVKQAAILYLLRDKFQFYSPFLSGILEFKFVPEIISDLDVINKELLENVLSMFITTNKITPSNIVIVLADNVSFIKDISSMNNQPQQNPQQQQNPQEVLQNEENRFLDHIPFEFVVSKTFPMQTGIRVYAVNQELFTSLKNVFTKQKFVVESVLPGIVFGNNFSSRLVLDQEMIGYFLQNVDSLKQFDLLRAEVHKHVEEKKVEKNNNEVSIETVFDLSESEQPKTDKKRLVMLSGVFGVLIIILIAVYFMSNQQPSQTMKSRAATPSSTIVAPPNAVSTPASTIISVSPALSQAMTNSAVDIRSLTVQIVNASASDQSGVTLRNQLAPYGFKTIEVQRQTNVGLSGVMIAFSSTVSQNNRNLIVNEARKLTANVNVQERSNTAFDIIIIIGK